MLNWFKKISLFMSSSLMIFIFMCLYIVLGFGTVCPNLCGNTYFNFFANIVKGFGLVILFFSIFNKSKWKLDLRLILLLAFVVSYLASCYFTKDYGGLFNNVKGVLWILLQAVLLAGLLNDGIKSPWFCRLLIFYVSAASIFALISVIFAIIGYIYIPSLSGGDVLWMGMSSGRLFGFYKDPNYGAIYSSLCIFCIIFLLIKNSNYVKIVFGIFLIVIQIIVIAMSGSRTALIALLVSGFLTVGFFIYKFLCNKNLSNIKSIVLACMSAVGVCGLLILSFIGVSTAYEKFEPAILKSCGGSVSDTIHIFTTPMANETSDLFDLGKISGQQENQLLKGTNKDADLYVHEIYKESEPQDVSNNQKQLLQSNTFENNVLDASSATNIIGENKAAENIEGDIAHVGLLSRNESEDPSNNRFSLWKNAIDLWLKSPILGVSHYNILNYSKAIFPQGMYSMLGQITAHNAFLDILAAQGIIGVLIFIVLCTMTSVGIIRLVLKHNNNSAYLFCVIGGIFSFLLVASMFYPQLIYINTVDVVFFWYIIGLVRTEENVAFGLHQIRLKK